MQQENENVNKEVTDWITKRTGIQPEVYLGIFFAIALTITLVTEYVYPPVSVTPSVSTSEAGIVVVAKD